MELLEKAKTSDLVRDQHDLCSWDSDCDRRTQQQTLSVRQAVGRHNSAREKMYAREKYTVPLH